MPPTTSSFLSPSLLGSFRQSTRSFTKRTLTMDEMEAVEISERTMSTLSIVSSLFVLATFLCFANLRAKLVNRLLFYATWGNLLTNVATLISVSGVKAGNNSSLCQTQGFLIQWFMPADTLWAFCLSLNVFLTFHTFRGKIKNIRSLEPYYIAFCYGLPFIPALTYLILDVATGNNIYGNATIWCWITEQHNVLRIATFYGPVWVVITCTIIIYSIIGWRIWRDRVRVRKSSTAGISTNFSADGVTEIRLGGILVSKSLHVEVGSTFPVNGASPFSTLNRESLVEKTPQSVVAVAGINRRDFSSCDTTEIGSKRGSRPGSKQSSAPEILEGIDANKSGARIATTVTAATTPTPDVDTMASAPRMNTQSMRGAKTYAQVAFMLFIIMCIVWIPSTVNRLYTFVQPTKSSFGLNLAASIVLPLQGFFNCVIYIMTSRQQMRAIFRQLWNRFRGIDATPDPGPNIITHPSASIGSRKSGVLDGLPQGATPEDLDKFFADYDRFQQRTGSRPSAWELGDDIEELEVSVGMRIQRFPPLQVTTPKRKFSAPSEFEHSPGGGVSIDDDQASLVSSDGYTASSPRKMSS